MRAERTVQTGQELTTRRQVQAGEQGRDCNTRISPPVIGMSLSVDLTVTHRKQPGVPRESLRLCKPGNAGNRGYRLTKSSARQRALIPPADELSADGQDTKKTRSGNTEERRASRAYRRQAVSRFKQRIREITRRDRGVGMKTITGELIRYLTGWEPYYGKGLSIALKKALNRWIIRRLKAFLWNQWRLPRTKVRMLKRLGLDHGSAVKLGNTRKSAWRASRFHQLNFALPEKLFWKRYGLQLLA